MAVYFVALLVVAFYNVIAVVPCFSLWPWPPDARETNAAVIATCLYVICLGYLIAQAAPK